MEDYQREFLMNHIPSYILYWELEEEIDNLHADAEIDYNMLRSKASPLEAKAKELSDAVSKINKDAEENVIKFTEMFDENAVEGVRINAYDTFRQCVGPCEDFDGYMIDTFVSAIINESEDHCLDLYNQSIEEVA